MSPVTAACPNCGAAVEFRFDDSFVRVCGYCNAVVARADRGFESLGRMGDLAASGSPLALHASGRLGQVGFQLVGRAQIAHARGGGWEEWYARFDNDEWGWLSEAQGRFQLSFPAGHPPELPRFESLRPGQVVPLALPGRPPESFTVGEVGEATYRAAAGEMPYRLVPGQRFRYADLSGDRGGFATVDAGIDPGDPVSLYVGREVSLGDLQIAGGAAPAPAGPTVSAHHVACVQCGGSLELRAPDASLRVVCPYCSAMLDVSQGHLSYLRSLESQQVVAPDIPLGSTADFEGQTLTLIGCLVRSVNVEGINYPFTEYLLYHPAVGYRWLVESDRHWSYVTPVSPGAVSDLGRIATYENRRYRHFQSAEAKVDRITGEFYWKVELGERVRMSDYVRPPYLLSCEEGGGELQASLALWMKPEELSARIRPPGGEPGSLQLPPSQSVAPHQPFPHRGILMMTAALALLLLVSAAVLGARSPSRSIDLKFDPPLDEPVLAPEDATAPVTTSPDGAVFSRVHFSQPFDVEDGMNLAIHFSSILSNSWDYVAVDLVNEDTGLVQSFDVQLESYSGVEGGESWQEGDSDRTVHIGAVSAGRHALRLELQWPGATRSRPTLKVTMRQGVFRGMYLSLALGLLLVIPLLIGLQKFLFEKRRWSESDHPWSTGSSDE